MHKVHVRIGSSQFSKHALLPDQENHNNKQEEKKCYQEIVTDVPKWSRAIDVTLLLEKVTVFIAQTEQPI